MFSVCVCVCVCVRFSVFVYELITRPRSPIDCLGSRKLKRNGEFHRAPKEKILSYTYFKIYVINLILFVTRKSNEVPIR
jgi:hypothetical protein